MSNTLKRQSGSAHVAIAVVLVVALLGALGFIFWQNFIANSKTAEVASEQSGSTETPKEATVPVAEKKEITKQKIGSWIQMNDSVQIEDYMTETVNYAFAHSDGIYNDSPKAQAVKNIGSYLVGNVSPWVSQDFEKITGHEAFMTQVKNDTYFDFNGSYVSLNTGTDSEDFAAFKINDEGLITDVYVGTVLGF